MKYYIDGKLVRTSKTRTYTHAVMFGDEVVSCCGSYLLACKELDKRINHLCAIIRDSRAAIEAIDNGKSYYMARIFSDNRRPYKNPIKRSREEYEKWISESEDKKTRWHIRELEAEQ